MICWFQAWLRHYMHSFRALRNWSHSVRHLPAKNQLERPRNTYSCIRHFNKNLIKFYKNPLEFFLLGSILLLFQFYWKII